jgi:N-acetylmuramic acid 6-phosphate etherase
LSKRVFNQIKDLVTEERNPDTFDIDTKSTLQILKLINREDKKVASAVEKEIPNIARAVDLIVNAFKNRGRLFYVGAGTSGRLGVLDAAECPPTFGTPPGMIKGIIAGGRRTLVRSKEGVEDDFEAGARDLEKNKISKKDVVVGIAASRRTPYVLGALERAKKVGAKTIFVFCNPTLKLKTKVDVAISPILEPEVIAGSTRMKAASAQKMILNMLTTASMIKMGKVYQNLMVDLQARSEKLVERSKRIIMMTTGVDYKKAEKCLKESGGKVKIALVMILAKVDKKTAEKRLKDAGGFVAKAISVRVGMRRSVCHSDPARGGRRI